MVKLLSFKIFEKEIEEIKNTIEKIKEFKKNSENEKISYSERYNELNYREIKDRIREIKNLFGEGDKNDSEK